MKEDIIYYINTPFRKIYNIIKKIYINHKNKNIIFKNRNKIYYKKNNQIYTYDNYENLYNVITNIKCTYHYKINKNEIKHTHNFEKILKEVFNYPETFKIPNEYINEYSNQQINLIKETQKN